MGGLWWESRFRYLIPVSRLQDVFVTPNEAQIRKFHTTFTVFKDKDGQAVFIKREKKPGILPRMLHEILQPEPYCILSLLRECLQVLVDKRQP